MSLLKKLIPILLLATALHALPSEFSAPAPLTNTRYVPFGNVASALVSNGRDPVLLWSDSAVRMTRLVRGENRAGRAILDGYHADAVWTGTHFIVVATQSRSGGVTSDIVARLADANGEPLSGLIPVRTAAGSPSLAWNGRRALMLYNGNRTTVLGANGILVPDRGVQSIGAEALRSQVTSNGSGFASVTARVGEVQFTTYDNEGSIAHAESVGRGDDPTRQIEIASDGNGYMAVWTANGRLEAATFRADGTGLQLMELTTAQEPGLGAPAVAFANGRYHVVYTGNGLQRHVSVGANGITRHPDVGAGSYFASIVVAGGRATVSWSTPNGIVVARDLLDESDRPVEIAWGAAQQGLVATATSGNASLVVWNENSAGGNAVWVGTRDRFGDWSERRLIVGEAGLLAASNGQGFVVVTYMYEVDNTRRWTAHFLGEDGRLIRRSERFSGSLPASITSNGVQYALALQSPAGHLEACLLSTTGELGSATRLHTRTQYSESWLADIAWDGTNYLVVWHQADPSSCFPPADCFDDTIRAARLGPALQRLDVQDVLIAEDPAVNPSVVWDGSAYVIAWSPLTKNVGVRRMLPTGELRAPVFVPMTREAGEVTPMLTRADGGVLLTWNFGELVALQNESVVSRTSFAGQVVPVQLPDGRTAAVYSAIVRSEPHHGSYRLLMAIGEPKARSDAPSLRLDLVGGNFALDWDAPPQPVNGYRLEYRVGPTGVWNEWDAWFGADETSTRIAPWRVAETFQFRVRAWSDGGVSAYSNVVMSGSARKHRAARR